MPDSTGPFRPLNIDLVRDAVARTKFAEIAYRDQTGSTNDDAALVLGNPKAGGTTFVVEEQTAGKGRKAGRRWVSPRGAGLTFTTILPGTVRTADLWAVPYWTALAVADAINRSCAVRVELRWPNDLFFAGRKVGGILCISRVLGESAAVACGIGLNVFRPPGPGAAGIDPPPGYLAEASARARRELLLADILLSFRRRRAALSSPDVIARTYEERAGIAGARYRLRLDMDGRLLEGVARGIGRDGALRLEVNGMEQLVAMADARRL